MGLTDFLDALAAGEDFAQAMTEVFRMAGLAALVLVLVLGLIFFLPTIVASMRHIKARVAVCVLNVLAIATLFIGIFLPIIVWLVIMIMAIAGSPEIKTGNKLPPIIIHQNKED